MIVGFRRATPFVVMRRDTKTRYQGVFARHREGCGVEHLGKAPTLAEIAKACTCEPVCWGGVWDRASGKKRKTSMHRSIAEARNARADLQASLREGAHSVSMNTRIKPLIDTYILQVVRTDLRRRLAGVAHKRRWRLRCGGRLEFERCISGSENRQ